MRLTKHSDYAIRVLLLAESQQNRNLTVEQTALLQGLSAPHLKKVVRTLTAAGFLLSVRGRSGGFRLARPPEEIGLGAVIRVTEPDFALVECYREGSACRLTECCKLPPVLNEALAAMFEVLDRYTLADLALRGAEMLPAAPPARLL